MTDIKGAQVAQEKKEAVDISFNLDNKIESISQVPIFMYVHTDYKMSMLAKQLMYVDALGFLQSTVYDAEKFTKERNGKTIIFEDVCKVLGIYEEDIIILLKRAIAKVMVLEKRNEG